MSRLPLSGFILITFALAACSRAPITVEVFVRTRGGETVRLSAASIIVATEESLADGLAAVASESDVSSGIPKDKYDTFVSGLSPDRRFAGVVTDADGKAQLKGVARGAFIIVKDQRRIVDSDEEYLWIIAESDARGGRLLLSNRNLVRDYANLELLVRQTHGLAGKVAKRLEEKCAEQLARDEFAGARTCLRNLGHFGGSGRSTTLLATINKKEAEKLRAEAEKAVRDENCDKVFELLRRAIELSPDREWDEKLALLKLDTCGMIVPVPSVATSLAVSPDGRLLASCGLLAGRTVKLWDMATGNEVRTLIHYPQATNDEVSAVAFSPDGRFLASASACDGTVKLWEVATGKEVRTIRQHGVWSVAFSPDGRFLASGSGEGAALKLVEVATGKEVWTVWAGSANSLAFSPDGRFLAGRADLDTVKLWEVATGKQVRSLRQPNTLMTVTFSHDGRYLASGGWEFVDLWDVATGQEVRTLRGHASFVKSVAFSPDGRFLASGGYDTLVKLWDVATGKEVRTLRGHALAVSAVAFSPDGRFLVSGSDDRTIRLWPMRTQEPH
jgi:WD40 repeat protein